MALQPGELTTAGYTPVVRTRREWADLCAVTIAGLDAADRLAAIFQSSSGSTSAPVLVPRRPAEIEDTFRRVAAHYARRIGAPPRRVAMLGGSSHAEVAARWTMAGAVVAFFDLDDRDDLERFDPDAVSCYPSAARELAAEASLSLPSLRAIKLGGERVFRADLRAIARRWPDTPVIEQLGSTEMPAVAIRVHEPGRLTRAFSLESGRFDFRFAASDGWVPLIVRDRLPDRLVLLDDYYDTGDDVLLHRGDAIDVRRRSDCAMPFFEAAEGLFDRGCIQVQFRLAARTLVYTGRLRLPASVDAGGRTFTTRHVKQIDRDQASGKLPLVLS